MGTCTTLGHTACCAPRPAQPRPQVGRLPLARTSLSVHGCVFVVGHIPQGTEVQDQKLRISHHRWPGEVVGTELQQSNNKNNSQHLLRVCNYQQGFTCTNSCFTERSEGCGATYLCFTGECGFPEVNPGCIANKLELCFELSFLVLKGSHTHAHKLTSERDKHT